MVDIKEKLAKGYVQSVVIIELVGKPKEHVEGAIKLYLEKIENNSEIEVLKKDISEIKEMKEAKGFFGSFIELEILIKDFPTLAGFCFDYMPSSIEIIAPKEFKIKESELSTFFNDLQGKLHSLDAFAKRLNQENDFIKNNLTGLMRNFVSLLLMKTSLDAEQLSKYTGYKKEELEKFLEIMVKESRLKKEDGKYILVKQ